MLWDELAKYHRKLEPTIQIMFTMLILAIIPL